MKLVGVENIITEKKKKNEAEKITVMNGWEVSNVEALHSKPIQDKEPSMTQVNNKCPFSNFKANSIKRMQLCFCVCLFSL